MTEPVQGGVAEPTDAAPAVSADASTTSLVETPAVEKTGAEPVLDAEGKPVVEPKADDGPPDTYADFTPPEGVPAPAGELMTEFAALAKELGMSQAKAQDAFALVAKLAEKGAAGKAALEASRAEAARTAALEANAQAVRSDKEFGGEKLAENLAVAKAAMAATTTPAFREMLDKSGLANHPEMIRMFLKVAPAFAESKHVPGGKAPGGDKPAAKVLYPNAA
jgi:hypothetical protein